MKNKNIFVVFYVLINYFYTVSINITSGLSMFSNGKALVVDDNYLNQIVLKTHLEKMGFSIDLASNGQEALELLNTNFYDVTLMDIQMPIMDGIECTRKIRLSDNKTLAAMPVIAVTANMDQYSDSLDTCDINGLVSKPVDVNMLTDMIKVCLSDNIENEN